MTIAAALVLFMAASPVSKAADRNSTSSGNYEVMSIGTGTPGTKILKVYVTDRNKKNAPALARKAAVEACLFRGIPAGGRVAATPALCSISAEKEHADFFGKFFAEGGQYLRYVNLTSEGAIPDEDIIKVKGGYKVGVIVQVMYDNLRRDLQDAGIIRSLGSGF